MANVFDNDDDRDPTKPGDTRNDNPAAREDQEFGEFDDPPRLTGPEKGRSLGDLWRSSPLVKIAVIVVAIVGVAAAFILFGGKKDVNKSEVGTAVQDREAPGGDVPEAYRTAIEDVNQQRLEQAMQTGSSTIPIPVATPDTPMAGPDAQPPGDVADPLSQWRAASQDQTPQQAAQMQPTVVTQPNGQQTVMYPAGPDPAAVQALAQGMSMQMQAILDKHKIIGPQIMAVTDRDWLRDRQAEQAASLQTAAAAAAEPVQDVQQIVIPAGTIAYAQMLTEANSDAPGPVLARLNSGALNGARVIGTFKTTRRYLTLDFSTVVVKGVSYSVNAVAIDPKTTLPAVVTDFDRRYFERFLLPAAARFIEGMGDAIAQREQTNVSVNGSTVVSSTPSLNTREEIAAGFAAGTSEIADDLDQEGNDIQPLIRVRAGTPIGVLFLNPVVKNMNTTR